MVRAGEACLDAAARVHTPTGPCPDVFEDELLDIIRRGAERFPVRRVKGVRKLDCGVGLKLDVAMCGAEG